MMYEKLRFIFRATVTVPSLEHCYSPQNLPPLSSFLRSISRNICSEGTNKLQFTVSYLVNSCGLSLEFAKSASKLVQFETPDRPDLFLSLLKRCDFSQTQISKVVKQCPRLLLCRPEATVLPKLEFFRSKGLTTSQVAELISSWPSILTKSLNNCIIPSYDYLKGFLQSDEKVIKVLSRNSFILSQDIDAIVAQKISIFQENGVSELNIHRLLFYWPGIFIMNPDKICKVLREAREMGLDFSKLQCFEAIRILISLSKSTWDSKVNVFRKWNLSQEQVLEAFRRCPLVMNKSENKIMAVMEFLVNQLDWEPSIIVKYPALLNYSLEKRLIPRATVLQCLVLKGLAKKQSLHPSMFMCNEETFLLKFVNCYSEAPELLKLYGEKLQIAQEQGPVH